MSSVDNRIVEMEFNNRSFESGIAKTLSTLDKLKKALTFSDSSKGLADLENKANSFDVSGMAAGIDNVSSKFSALGAVGFSVIQRLTNGVITFGKNVLGAAIDPIFSGGRRRAENIEQAKFQFKGLGIDVTKAMESALEAVQGTAYGLDEAARAAGQFAASGIEVGKPMTSSLRAIAGVAAQTGSSFEDISNVFVSIAGNGRLMGNDLLQLSTRGLNAAAILAKSMNKTEAEVREMVTAGEISFEDFSKAMDNAFGKNATKANELYSGALSNMRAALARLGEKFFTPRLENQRDIFNALTPVIDKASEALEPFIELINDLDKAGTDKVIENISNIDFTSLELAAPHIVDAIKNVLGAIGDVLTPLKDAFRDIFPASTPQQIENLAAGIERFTEKLRVGEETGENLRRTFRGVFAIFSIIGQIISGVASAFGIVFGQISNGESGILGVTGGIGDMLVAFDNALKSGNFLGAFFDTLGNILRAPIMLFQGLAHAISGLFSGFGDGSADSATNSIERFSDSVSPLGEFIDRASESLNSFFSNLSGKIQPALEAVAGAFSNLGDLIVSALSGDNFDKVLSTINTGLLGGIFLLIKRFLGNFSIFGDAGAGLLENISGTFEGLTDSLGAMTAQIKSKTLLQIAAAVALLAGSLVLLSTIDSNKLESSLLAMGAAFGQLLFGMAILSKIGGVIGFVKIPVIAGSMILLAGAITILTGAMKILSTMDWNQIAKGLVGVGVLLAEVSVAALVISKNSGNLVSAGIGITAMAIAINILALAVKQFAKLDWASMAKGLVGVAGSLAAVAAGMRIMPKGMAAMAVGLIGISIALQGIYFAVSQFSKLDWESMAKGLVGVAGSLVIIAGAMQIMPKSMALQAAGLLIVASTLHILAKAVSSLGNMSWETIGKGLGTIAAALGILAAAMNLMKGTLPAAGALIIVAGALSILAPVLKSLGKMNWGAIAKGLTTLAVSLGILIVAAKLAAGAAPGLIALSVAAVALGAGIALAGVGIGALSAGLAVLAASGSAGIAILISAITAIIAKIPELAVAFAKGFVEILAVIGESAPQLIAAFGAILLAITTAIIENAPVIAQALGVILTEFLNFMVENAPKIIQAGLDLLMQFLSGIANNIERITVVVANIIIKFLNALAVKLPAIVTAGVNLLVAFLRGIASNIGRIVVEAGRIVAAFIRGVAQLAGSIISAGADLIIDFVTGLARNAVKIVNAGANAVIKFAEGLGKNAVKLAKAAGKIVLDLINGMREAVKEYTPKIVEAGVGLGADLIKGIGQGLLNAFNVFESDFDERIAKLLNNAKAKLKIKSPSRVFADEIGKPIAQGIAMGIMDNMYGVDDVLDLESAGVIGRLSDAISKIPAEFDKLADFEPSITPVLDLTMIKKDAEKIGGLINLPPFDVTTAYDSANSVSLAQIKAAQEAEEATENVAPVKETVVQFNQTNTSPEALSEIEIYRRTQNLLGQSKTSLGFVP